MANLVIVSNRLPVSVKKVDGALTFYPSVGGLATGLSSYANDARSKWVGWPGLPSDDLSSAERVRIAKELKKHRCYPVFLTQKQLDDYYNGYSNSVLWPLFHHLPVVRGNTAKNWEAYQRANELFADEVLRLSKPGSTIWVHDYQLLVLPELLRAERPTDKIGFFLHIPFPAVNFFSNLNHATELIEGMLGADLIGLHTQAYGEQFLANCQALHIGVVGSNKVALPNRAVRVTDFPMGIDYGKFARATRQRAVRLEYQKLRWKHRGQRVIVTVDRLDPTKGLVERLAAYQTLLKRNAQLHKKVVMVMLAVPTRTDIVEYQQLKLAVETLVQQINTTFGTPSWQPVEYLYQTLPFEKLTALYQRADVAFIAPIRDGMNLVAKEYLASKPRHDGVLILSETAGAADELKDAVQVNPAKPKSLVEGLGRALSMPKKELQRRTTAMQKHLKHFTVQNWADSFMNSLEQPHVTTLLPTRTLNKTHAQQIVANFHQSGKRLLLLDYDGVLRLFMNDPAAAKPSAQVLRLLKHLSSDRRNELVVISGRSKTDLSDWFGSLPIALAAEHGAFFRRRHGQNWHITSTSGTQWVKQVQSLLEYYASLTPGAFVEKKEWSLVWHYRGASPYHSQKHLVALRRLLKPILKQHNLVLKEGHKVLEVHPADISKGRIAQEWLIHDHDFVLAIGDDATDEDMFAALPSTAYSVKVGRGTTLARFRVKGVPEVLQLLGKL